MKKILAMVLCLCMVAACFAGCNAEEGSQKALKVGVIQYMSHPSLDNCYNGVAAALEASSLEVTIDRQIGSSNAAESDCISYAKNMVAANYDMIVAIATPAAQAAFAAVEDTDIPVIFCAVSDPVSAKLVDSMEKPGQNCTGTSDVLDLKAQLEMILAFQPEAKTIGILYTASEENSLTNLKNFKDVCAAKGITVEASAVQNASDIPAAAEALAAKVDCINNFTDNNVVNNLSVLLNAAEKYGIPVYGSEEEQVKNGCMASVSINYVALGKVTGEMAAQVLGGADAGAMAVKTITDAELVYNSDVVSQLGLTLPAQYENAINVK
ncbi:MAG: ABC transporter substrate-binding protein [Oscillospiraceae bacterium]|nr:ABC transporter substrate-binding protein [Oscillospiraceae bacterium]